MAYNDREWALRAGGTPGLCPRQLPGNMLLARGCLSKGPKILLAPGCPPDQTGSSSGQRGGCSSDPPRPSQPPTPGFPWEPASSATAAKNWTKVRTGKGLSAQEKLHFHSLMLTDLWLGYWNCSLNSIWTGLFWFSYDSLKMGVMSGRFKNWVGTSYHTEIDARHEDLQLTET